MKTFIKLLLLVLAFTALPSRAQTVTIEVCHGTATNQYVPVYGYEYDTQNTTSQMIYPADKLGLLDGDVIKGITFHTDADGIQFRNGQLTVTIALTDDSSLSGIATLSGNTARATVVPTRYATTLNVTFNDRLEYVEGKNLIVQTQVTSSGNYGTTDWYGETQATNTSRYRRGGGNGSGTAQQFLPWMDLTYEPKSPYQAKLSGNGDFGGITKGTTKPATFIVRNGGSEAFTPVLTSDNDAFTVEGDMTTQLDGGASRDFTVTFTAAKAQEYTGVLTLSASESAASAITATANLSGTGFLGATVADGTEPEPNDNVPVYGYNFNSTNSNDQMIYPTSMLGAVDGKKIKSITFYSRDGIKFGNPSGTYGTGDLTVTMGTTSDGYFSSAAKKTISGTTVSKTITPIYGAYTMTITFDEPLEYNTSIGNLIIDTQVSERGASSNGTNWYGIETNGYQSIYYSNRYNRLQFLPKITFEFEPYIKVDETALDFGEVPVGTTSAAQKVNVTNETEEDAVLRFSNSKFSSTTTSIPAGETVEVSVTFAPGNTAGEQTGTLTITAGDKSAKVDLRGFGLAPYAATIDPQTVDFGECSINKAHTATVTLTNIGSQEINPTFTDPASPFSVSVTGETGALAKGETRTYTITFAPTAKETFSDEFTIADASHGLSYRVTLSGKGADMVLETNSPLNFGLVDLEDDLEEHSKTLDAEFTNPYSDDITVSLSLSDDAPFFLPNGETSLTIPAGQTKSVSVTFAPPVDGGAISYTGVLTASSENVKTDVVLRGAGKVNGPEAIRDKAFFEGIPYTWKENGVGAEHTNNLAEIATDPDQIIAMLREIYMNKEIPGNYKRGFDTNGGDEDGNDVSYAAVGTITSSGGNLSYEDTYGWKIPEDPAECKLITSGSYTYLDPEQFKPEQNGLTILLVETKDGLDWTYDWAAVQAKVNALENPSNYDKLRTYISETIKSVRVITEAMRTGDGYGAGTLFKIDCDKLNKFYIMAKGQLLVCNSNNRYLPYYNNGWNENTQWTDYPFYHMFEQFSPVSSTAESAKADIYQELVNMESFGVQHDCTRMFYRKHQFNMYGKESESEDCQDVRDMMFFVPDYRMMYWSGREQNPLKFFNYNQERQPQIGLFVIRQDPVTCPDNEECRTEEYYKLTLTWDSNLDDFLPSKQQEYHLMQLVQDELGHDIYVPVYYLDENGNYVDEDGNPSETAIPIILQFAPNADKTYTEVYVQRTPGSQQVTYAIQGQDTDEQGNHFMTLQISNRQSYIIPGLDPAEMILLSDATHYSRFNPANQTNCYSNKLKIDNNPQGVKKEYLADDTKLTFKRMLSLTDPNPVTIAEATVSNASDNGGTLTIQMYDQALKSEFPEGASYGAGAGYHHNEGGVDVLRWTHAYTISSNGDVNFGKFIVFDNFVADVSANAHPNQYFYKIEFTTAIPFTGMGGVSTNNAYSNSFRIPVHKIDSEINLTYDKDAVDNDGATARMTLDENVEFGELVWRSSKTEILRYDVYRWNSENPDDFFIIDEVGDEDEEEDLPPDGIAGNQGESYTVSMNKVGTSDYTTSEVSVAGGSGWAEFVDVIPTKENSPASSYTYAPVVETFTSGLNVKETAVRTDYNTYGGPLQKVAVGKLNLQTPSENDMVASIYEWEKDGVPYCYYNVPITINAVNLPTGYEVYKIRAWRLADLSMLGEQEEDEVNPDRSDRLSDDYLFEEINFGDNIDVGDAGMNKVALTNYDLGSRLRPDGNSGETMATFGARKLADGETMDINFIIRVYFTKENVANAQGGSGAGAPRRRALTPETLSADGKYYVAEGSVKATLTSGIVTGLGTVKAQREVTGVTYINTVGQMSSTPWQGINIVVTRYSDGSTTTKKVIR